MRFLIFIGLTVGSVVGWWIGSYVGIGTAFLLSTVGSLAGVHVVCRLVRDYL